MFSPLNTRLTVRPAALVVDLLGITEVPGSRRWAVASLINAVGSGLLLPLSVLYFTLHVGLSTGSVGLGLTVGGLVALAFVPAGGLLVDRFGSKAVLLSSWTLAAAAYTGYGLVGSWAGFLVVVTGAEIAAAVGATAGKVLVTELASGPDRITLLASQRSLGNLGYAVGGLLATVALAVGGPAFLCVVYANAVTFVVAILLMLGVTVPHSQPAGAERPHFAHGLGRVLADRRYLTLTALDALTTFQDGALLVAMPLWVVLDTRAPRGLPGVLLTINTAVVVLTQVKATRQVRSLAQVPRSYRRAAALMGLSALAYLGAHYVGPVPAVGLLVLALLLHTATEIAASAGQWLASVELADPAHRGAYLGVYRLGFSVQDTLAPLVVTSLLALGAVWLWPVLALLVCVGSVASAGVVARSAPADGPSRHAREDRPPMPMAPAQ